MNPTFINTAVYSTNLKLTIYQLLKFIDKPADMKSITHCMMHLDGERKYDFFIISVIFPNRKNRNQIIISFLQILIIVLLQRLHHLKNDSIRVSEIKRSAFPKSICSEIEILRFRQALHMIFDKGFVDRVNVIRVKAYF